MNFHHPARFGKRNIKIGLIGACLLMMDVLSAGLIRTINQGTANAAARPTAAALRESFAQLPLSFEANQGQADAQVKFQARGPGYHLWLTGDEAVLALQG